MSASGREPDISTLHVRRHVDAIGLAGLAQDRVYKINGRTLLRLRPDIATVSQRAFRSAECHAR